MKICIFYDVIFCCCHIVLLYTNVNILNCFGPTSLHIYFQYISTYEILQTELRTPAAFKDNSFLTFCYVVFPSILNGVAEKSEKVSPDKHFLVDIQKCWHTYCLLSSYCVAKPRTKIHIHI